MEGKKDSLSRTTVAIIVILLFHAVGLAGFFVAAFRPLFLQIVPLHLLLMLLMIMYSYGRLDTPFLLFAMLVYSIGYTGEWIGVHKAWVFGDYHYGRTLGPKLSGIPLTMGINWFLLVYAAGVTMQYSRIKWLLARVVLGAVILVLLDVLIEPIAQRFDYWQWTTHSVPFKNYEGWFVISAGCLLLFEGLKFKKLNPAAVVLLAVQFVFFGLLQWV